MREGETLRIARLRKALRHAMTRTGELAHADLLDAMRLRIELSELNAQMWQALKQDDPSEAL